MNIFFFLANSILLFVPAFYAGKQCFKQDIFRSLLWGFSIVLCFITSLELVLGGLEILNTLNLFIGSLFLGLSTLIYLRVFPPSAIESDLKIDEIYPLTNKGVLALLFIATVLSIPVQSWLIEYLFKVHRIYPLPLTSWDVVTYHLPNALDYLQTGSLWTMKGSFSQYPGGNELINIWSFLPLKNDAMLGINILTFTSIIGLSLTHFLLKLKTIQFSLYYWVANIIFIIIFLLQIDFQTAIFDFGRNDLSLACVEILALWTFLECQRSPALLRNWILLGCLLGIGIGIKPNAIYYFIGLSVLICLDFILKRSFSTREFVQLLRKLILVSGFAFLFGGFWYIRNIIKLGSVFESSILDAGFPGAIVNHLFNPNLYVLDNTNITLAVIGLINILGCGVLVIYKTTNRKNPKNLNLDILATLLGFNLVALISFIFTPHSSGFWAGGQWIFKTQLRYGLTLIPVSIVMILEGGEIIFSLLFAKSIKHLNVKSLNAWMHSLHQPIRSQLTTKSSTGLSTKLPWQSITIILLLCLMQTLSYRPPQGLPNFDAVLFARFADSPLSRVYQWTQDNLKDQTIYTIALRPYGLYNFPFSNRVIYGGDSDQWSYQSAVDILNTEQPDYIALGRNPFNGKFPIALEDLLQDTQRFELVYGDVLAVVFQVK